MFYFDYGLSLQYLDGSIRSSNGMIDVSESVDTPLPALHLAAGIDLRKTMSVDLEFQGAKYAGNSLNESEFTLTILPNQKSGLSLGYRIFDLDFSSDDSSLDVEFRGGFLGATLGF